MYISTKDWKKYIDKLSAMDKKAGELMKEWIQRHGFGDVKALTDYAYAVATKYGEGSAALAAAMYDAIAELSGKFYEAAEVAPTPAYGEVAKTVNGTLKHSQNPNSVSNAISRLVKRTGADTVLKNAERDGAQFAWVPNGDTCAFCITLASRGWQYMSKKALKNGHAEHIHANCDCTYAIRFDNKSGVRGYDPQKYEDMYYGVEGDSPNARINALRRMRYEQNKELIRTQKREADARNRRIHYGELKTIASDRGSISARKVDRYSYNNIYVDETVTLTERELKRINQQITDAKAVIDWAERCDAPIVITDLGEETLAAYNPHYNTLLINKRLNTDTEIVKMQQEYTCPNDTRSTVVHEMFHWLDAHTYRHNIAQIDDASEGSVYSLYQKEMSRIELEKAGISGIDYDQLRSISNYALIKAIDNDWEEVYTEYRTQQTLK